MSCHQVRPAVTQRVLIEAEHNARRQVGGVLAMIWQCPGNALAMPWQRHTNCILPPLRARQPVACFPERKSLESGVTMLQTIVLAALVLLAACGTPPSSAIEHNTMGMCPGSPMLLTGTTPAGGSCTDSTQCKLVCCTCAKNPQTSWGAVACTGGTCSSSACAQTLLDYPDVCP